jgi:hypothetical protein
LDTDSGASCITFVYHRGHREPIWHDLFWQRLGPQESCGDDGDTVLAAIRLRARGDDHGIQELIADAFA